MTEDREYRILIVDDQRDVARVLRASLELLNRGYVIIDVPSAEEATLELTRPFDLIVSDYHLPGMTGPELLKRVYRRMPDIKAMIITGHPFDEVRANLKELEVDVVDIFEKPLDTEAFTNAVEMALHGEVEVAGAQEEESQPDYIPEFEERPMFLLLGSLLADLGAEAAALVSREGKVMLKQGMISERLRFSELAVLLAYNFTTTGEISQYLGPGPTNGVYYYDGSEHDIYALSVGYHYFLTIIFPTDNQKQMGPVLRYGKHTVDQMVEVLGQAAYIKDGQPAEPAEEALPYTEEVIEEPFEFAEPEVEELGFEDEAIFEDADEEEVDLSAVMLLVDEEEDVDAVDIDFDALDADLELDDLDNFWDEAAADADSGEEGSLSLEEAMDMGFMEIDDE